MIYFLFTFSGGYLIWNIAEGYEHYGTDYKRYDSIIQDHISKGRWKFQQPIRRLKKLVFTDCGAAMLTGYVSSGIACDGFVFVMQKM